MSNKKAPSQRLPKPPNLKSEPQSELTAIELAHLTALLVTAKLIPTSQDEGESPEEYEARCSHYHLIRAAIGFLETCDYFQALRRDEKEWTEWRNKLLLFRQQHNHNRESTVPISEVLALAGAKRLILTETELASLGIKEHWSKLVKLKQEQAIYLYLSDLVSNSGTYTPSLALGERVSLHNKLLFGDEKARKKQAKDGIPQTLLIQPNLIFALIEAKKIREFRKKSKAGKNHV